MLFHSIKVGEAVTESRLGAGGGSIDGILEAVSVTEEIGVTDRVVFVAVDEGYSSGLLIVDLESKRVENLSEDLGGHTEVTQSVSVLEEALCVESVLSDHLTESFDNFLDSRAFTFMSLTSTVDRNSANFTDGGIKVLLEALAGENFVDTVREFSPLDVVAFLRGLENLSQHLELGLRNGALSHGETNTELGRSDVAGAQAIKVTEEL